MSGDDLEVLRAGMRHDRRCGLYFERPCNCGVTAAPAALSRLEAQQANACQWCGAFGGTHAKRNCPGEAAGNPAQQQPTGEPGCVRCGAPYLAHGQCSRHAQGCQGGRGEQPTPPECPLRALVREKVLPKLAHGVECVGVRPTEEWESHGSLNFANCRCVAGEVTKSLSTPCSPCQTYSGMTQDGLDGAIAYDALLAERDALTRKVEKLVEALRQIQWGNETIDPDSDPMGATVYNLCPMCDQSEVRGHAPDCLVGMALVEHEKEQG